MGKNQYISFAVIVIIIIAVSVLFRDPAEEELEETSEEEVALQAKIEELEEEVEELLIEIDNLENELTENRLSTAYLDYEIRMLQQDNNMFLEELFLQYKFLVEENLVLDVYEHEGEEILYKETSDTEILYVIKNDDSYRLRVLNRGVKYGLYLSFIDINPEEGINWVGGTVPETTFQLGGVITDDEILKVNVMYESSEQEAQIVEIEEGRRIWYSSLENIKSLHSVKMEALDESGNAVWSSRANN